MKVEKEVIEEGIRILIWLQKEELADGFVGGWLPQKQDGLEVSPLQSSQTRTAEEQWNRDVRAKRILDGLEATAEEEQRNRDVKLNSYLTPDSEAKEGQRWNGDVRTAKGQRWNRDVRAEEEQRDDQSGPYLIRVKTGEWVWLSQAVFQIGRDRTQADYCILDNPNVSRLHVTFRNQEGQVLLVNGTSKNHTYVNGRQISDHGRVWLKKGDQIALANESFVFFQKEDVR